MSADFHADPVLREELISGYLHRRLSPQLSEQWENHYLGCTDCFEELCGTELLIRALGAPLIERTRINDVTLLRFARSTQLLAESLVLHDLSKAIRLENDTRVLIDLSRVSRIDSAGLGMLMNCYCHAVKNAGELKLLNPEAPVRRVLSVTRIDSVLQTFEDETSAIESFGPRNDGADGLISAAGPLAL
jgi:anti-anti-sigma factor